MAAGRLLVLLTTLAAAAGAPQPAAGAEELPKPAAHKQIVYRYIPIDKAFLGLDKAYDDYYGTSQSSGDSDRRNDYSYSRGDDRYYNYDHPSHDLAGYRHQNSRHGGHGASRNDVDSYSTYSHGGDHRHGFDSNRRNAHQDEYYDYDYRYDYAPATRRPGRRHRNKNDRQDQRTKSSFLDFAEAAIRRMFPSLSKLASSVKRDGQSGGHSGGYGGGGGKFPRFVTFDGTIRFLSYLAGAALVVGYIMLVVLNAVTSDGTSLATIFGRSLNDNHLEVINDEAMKLLKLLENAIQHHENGCVAYRLCQISEDSKWGFLKSTIRSVIHWAPAAGGAAGVNVREARQVAASCEDRHPECAVEQPAEEQDSP